MDCRPPGSSVLEDSLGKNSGMAATPSSGDLPNPDNEPMSPALQMDSLPSEPLGKVKNTGMGRFYLFQELSSAQKLNLHSDLNAGVSCIADRFLTS